MHDILGQRLSHAYSALLQGLFYPGSESDSPYFPICAALADGEITELSLRQALHLASFWKLRLEKADDWFKRTIDWAADPNQGNAPDVSQSYEKLQAAIKSTIEGDVFRFTVEPPDGKYHPTRHYVGGRVGKSFVGFMTFSVET